ncbi:MAG: nucleotidyltransferase domain-containing protein [Thermodesulfobacteriota bacterium]
MGSAIENQLRLIGNRYEIVALYAFGSRAREIAGKVHGKEIFPRDPHSDVDIGAQLRPGRHLSAKERVRLAIDLEDLLNVNRVDLVILSDADAFLALEIIRGELLYCADADAQAEYELYVLRRAGDLAFYARERWRKILMGTTP